jgi:isopenicillin N synthase-like dioxygenase
VEHRAVVNESEARMSMVYFASPPAKARIEIPEQLITAKQPLQFRSSFSWEEYKSQLLQKHQVQRGNGIKTSKEWLKRPADPLV